MGNSGLDAPGSMARAEVGANNRIKLQRDLNDAQCSPTIRVSVDHSWGEYVNGISTEAKHIFY